ncbi:DUF1992 domain-containing protein [Halobacillus sp. A1]|uniref:DnaJ family domain-containing protein n=1 Tax=Halobacillus sp. A1 TaxID=2880262 RepID=UPI0020A63865|nr:DUF1992 domain-containing protein [Halobacillus sp. A1]MCP3033585.1 DUF1992 domain-containing protein [Halobacillus sp. A1]
MKDKDNSNLRENITYKDHISQIVHEAEKKGDFDNLPGKGKPLNLNDNSINSYDAQLNKILKDNNVLPEWVKLGNEIDSLMDQLSSSSPKEKRKLKKELNKKIKNYNWQCPPSLQKNSL